jgi:PAS domain S-box-containing protein
MKRFSIQERTLALVRITDIDEKMRNKQMLLEEQQFVQAITQNTPNIIQLFDVKEYRYIWANGHLSEYLGYSIEEINEMENGVWDLFAQEDLPVLQNRYQENLKMKPGQVSQTEFRIKQKDGNWMWLLAYDTIFKLDKNNNVEQILGTIQNITERKNAELKLANFNEELEREAYERTKQLEEANKELEAFNYTVSHDLRNPVRAIEIFSSFLEKKYYNQIDDKAKDYIDQIRTSVRNITQLLDDLLAFSRLGRKEMKEAEVHMTELFEEVIQEIKYHYQEINNPEILFKDLHSVRGDYNMLRHVVLNLIGNAFKFTKYRDQPKIQIGSYIDENTDHVVFYVSDNGIGFDMQYAQKIFGVFERLHTDNEFEGTGGGLSIVERVINRHNGNIWAEGKKNKGATFYFSIPAHSA